MNIVLQFVKNVKNAYIEKYHSISYDYTDSETCLEHWVKELNNPTYISMIQPLEINQN